MSEIRVNYEVMRAAAGKFQAQADIVQQIIDTLNARAEQLMLYWESVAEQEFMEELQGCRVHLNRVPPMLSSIGQALQQTAAKFEEAETEASALTNSIITADN